MTFDEFVKKFASHNRFDKYWYHGLCICAIVFGLLVLVSLAVKWPMNFEKAPSGGMFMSLFFIALGMYGLKVLKHKYKIKIWGNHLPKSDNMSLIWNVYFDQNSKVANQNGNYVSYRYQRSWWRLEYEIHLFADEGYIAYSVEAIDRYNGGFIDFGASKRRESEVLHLLISKASN